jgi:catechol 2,3-dioxygenase-like lactoylglutathione lyase family enzyme
MTKFNYSGIHHAAFATADMDATVEFWRDLLGFKLVLTMDTKDGRQYAFGLSKDMLIYFFEWSGVQKVPPKRHGEPVSGPFHFDHLAIRLDSKTDLFDLQDCLVEAGRPVTDVIDHGYIYSVYTYDPNGVPLEFNTALPGFDLYENPVLTDRSASELVKRGALPTSENREDTEGWSQDRPVIQGQDAEIFKR